VVDSLVVVVHGHRQHLLGVVLSNHMLVQVGADLNAGISTACDTF